MPDIPPTRSGAPRRRHPPPTLASLLCCALLIGCSGDGNGDGIDPGSANLNAPLTGRMIIRGRGSAGIEYVLDLSSGRAPEFQKGVEEREGDSYDWGPTVPNTDGTRFHVEIENCEPGAGQVAYHSCIVTLDANGDEIGRFAVGRSVRSAVRESPDGTMLAFTAWNAEAFTSVLMITDRDGNVLSEGLFEDGRFVRGDVSDVRWLPDGDLVFLRFDPDQLVRVTGAPAARPEDDRVIFDRRETSMPGGDEATGFGGFDGFDTSPVSGEIAFVWNAHEPARTQQDDILYRMQPDGSGLAPLARSDTAQDLMQPRWSPDGRWIALRAGGAFIGPLSTSFVLAALRAGAEEELLIDEDGARESENIRFVRSYCRSAGCGTAEEPLVTEDKWVIGWYR